MVRLACISLPRIDLQILALRDAELRTLPAAVVTEEKPLGRIIQVNRAARSAGVQPGMRYASALSICPLLRAGVVEPEERVALRKDLVSRLRHFTPEVEAGDDDHALFWVNAGGLDRLYASLEQWAAALLAALQEMSLVANVAVGFSRFGTYAAAKSRKAITVFEEPDQEETVALKSPVGVLPLDHETLLRFHQLGLYTIRDFVRFSPGSLRRRFGREVEQLQRFARGESAMPVQWQPEEEPLRREMRLLYPESSTEALIHYQLELLVQLIDHVWGQQELIVEIVLELYPEEWPGQLRQAIVEHIQTARPTLDQKRLERLLRLRIESIELPAPVIRAAVEVRTVTTQRDQTDLFNGPPRRDPRKALTAIADICAEMGNDAVQVASLHTTHLPETRFSWHRVERLVSPRPEAGPAVAADPSHSAGAGLATTDGHTSAVPTDLPATTAGQGANLIRRILQAPIPFSASESQLIGPYTFSGGWWHQPHHRDYYYAIDPQGRVLWVYHDQLSSQWMVQGVVE